MKLTTGCKKWWGNKHFMWDLWGLFTNGQSFWMKTQMSQKHTNWPHNQCDLIGLYLKYILQIFLRKWPKYLLSYGRFEKCHDLCKNCSVYFLGIFCETLSYFKFHHLVTLLQSLWACQNCYQLFDGFEEDDDDGDVIGRAVVFGQLDEFLAYEVEIVWKKIVSKLCIDSWSLHQKQPPML